MIAMAIYGQRIMSDGSRAVRVDIQADAAPDPMPTTGASVTGLFPDAVIDAGSTLRVLGTSSTYRMGQDGLWYKWEG